MFARLDRPLRALLSTRRPGAWALALGLGGSLILGATLPLVADELYYHWWASVPDLGYLDHPPAVMGWAWLSEQLLWGPRAMGAVTLIAVGLSLTCAARTLKLARAALLPLIGLLTPFGLALGVLLTPDAPLLLGWSLTLCGWAKRAPLLAGLGGSLMLWSKPSALLPLTLVSWTWWRDDEGERRTAKVKVTRMWFITLALYLPHLLWSSAHDWLPWSFQASRSWGRFGLPEWVASQLWLVSPLWAWWGVRVALSALRAPRAQGQGRDVRRDLALIGLGQLLVWGVISLGMHVEGNWSALAWPPLLMLALDHLGGEGRSLERVTAATRWGVLLTAPLLATPLILRLTPLHLGPPRSPTRLQNQVHACLKASQPPQPAALLSDVVAGRYQEMALLWWASRTAQTGERFRLHYLNAQGRRDSEFTRRDPRPPLLCNFLYLGPARWLGARCEGSLQELDTPECLLSDRLKASRCLCAP